jgi:hypothetical protein
MQAMVRTILGGTLDDTSWLRPTRSKQPWIVLLESDQQFMSHSEIFGRTPRPSPRHGPE